MFRLAHISDPHLGPLPSPTLAQLASKRIFGYINWRRNRKGVLTNSTLDALIDDMRRQAPDHLAVTGDLVNLALPAEITNARKWLETLGTPEDVSAIPGNHDAYVPRARMSAEKSWAPFMRGDQHDERDWSPAYPYLRIRDNIALIGVSSATATMPLMATGYFRKAQARRLETLLEDCARRDFFRVVMIHHPPCRNATQWYKRLVGGSLFRKVIAKHGAELILHGHTHLATKMSTMSPKGPVPVICVPSASQGTGTKKPAARYNLFDIDGSPGSWRCNLIERGFDETGTLREIERQYLSLPNG